MIRLATVEDIPELKKLLNLSVRGLSTQYYTAAQIDSALKYIFGIDTQLIIDATYYVFEMDNIIAGYGGWSMRKTLYGGDQHKEVQDTLLDPRIDAARIRAFCTDGLEALRYWDWNLKRPLYFYFDVKRFGIA